MSKINTKLYITDEQYLNLLKKIRKDLDNIKEIFADDCTITGMKHTITNVGLCAGEETKTGWAKDKYTTRETAMWPKDFDKIGKTKYEYPQQFTMKYLQGHHICPLDNGKTPKHFMACGCFYRCRAFKDKSLAIQEVKRLYDKRIKEVENQE